MSEYSVEIISSSFSKIRGMERLRYTAFAGMTQLDEVVAEDGTKLAIDIKGYVACHVHNDKSDNPDYDKLVLIGTGTDELYVTGSDSFKKGFLEIYDALTDDFDDDGIVEADRVYPIYVFKAPSKNIKGKTFITCTVR